MDGVLQAFSNWMNGGGSSSLVSGGAVLLLVSPVLALTHELGHASVGLLRTKGLVVVHLGGTPARWRFRIGRLQLELNPQLAARNEPPAFAATYARLGVGARAMSALAGPLFHAVAASLIVLIGDRVHSTPVEVAGVLGILWALSSLVPRQRGGYGSDGAHLLDALRGRVTAPTELSDTYSRWLVLFSDDKSATRTLTRAKLFGGAPLALGYGPDGRADPALGLWRLAAAGWCWREVERSDPAGIREAALDALHDATVTGALEPDLTALAARNLARGPVELDGGFAQMPAELRSVATENERRFAFRYGVALREIEGIRT